MSKIIARVVRSILLEYSTTVIFFVWLYGISTFVGYLMPNSFLYK